MNLPETDPRRDLVLLLLPGWIAFMVYLPALLHGFVWDDIYYLSDLPYLRDPELWRRHIFEPLFVSRNYFRPIPLLTFVVEAQLGGMNPFVFHLTNLLLHAINTTLVIILARRLNRDISHKRFIAWIGTGAGLIYGLHPGLIEAVSWISDRFDLMMVMFLLLALLVDVQIRNTVVRAALIGLLFLLAALCKETTVVFAAMLPLWHLALNNKSGASLRTALASLLERDALRTYGAVFLAGLIYLAIRLASLGMLYTPDAQMAGGNIVQHVLLVAKTLGWYALLLFWPFGHLSPVHPGATPIALEDPFAWLSLVALLILACGIIYSIRKQPKAGYLLLATLAALAPVSNIVPLTIGDNIVHDRYLILPVAMLSLAMAAWLGTMTRESMRRIAAPMVILWAVAGCAAIVVLVPYWANNLTLWKWAYENAPESKVARGNYVWALANAKDDLKVLEIGPQILALSPDNAATMHNMSLSLMHLGRYEEAKAYSIEAIRHFEPTDPKLRLDISEAYNLLGYLNMRLGKWDEAEQALSEAVRITPYLTRPHFNLAMLYLDRGRNASAQKEIDFIFKYDTPEMAEVHARQIAEKKAEIALGRKSQRILERRIGK